LVGVLAVFENAYNQVSVTINNLAANINWGDGTSVVSNGALQTKVYNYSTIAATVYTFQGRNVKYVTVDITRVGGAITALSFWNATAINALGGNNYVDIIMSLPSATSISLSLSPISGTKSLGICQRIRVKSVGSGGTFSSCIRDARAIRVLEWPYSTGGVFANFMLGGGQVDDIGNVDLGTSVQANSMFFQVLLLKNMEILPLIQPQH
jgi:hypothetical protein